MAVEAGQDYNHDTAKALRPKRFSFTALGVTFAYTLDIPEYILARLDSSVMDRLQDYMQGHCTSVISDAIKGGYYHTPEGESTMRRDVAKHLKNYIWERFSITQQEAGQDCWQTAPTLQEVHV